MDVLGIVLTVLLLAANFFFVGAEFALISARRSIIEPMAREGNRRAKRTLWAIENVSLMMAGAQLGITVCSLALGYVTKPMIKYAVAGPLEAWGLSEVWIDVFSYGIALGLVTYLHVVLGEMVPKNIALSGPEKAALAMGPALVVVVKILRPLLWIMNACGNGILRLFKVTPKDEVTSAFTRDEVADLVAESRESGLLDRQDERLLMGALSFEARTIGSVAIPLAQVQTLPSGPTPAEVEAAAVNGFSRFPLVAPDGAWLGYVHVKDVIGADAERRERPISADMVRELPRFQADKAVRPALRRMQRDGAHLALAVDAAGEPVGVVTLEDVLEELVGQVRDDSRSAA